MKKGMCVVLDDDLKLNLMDSVNYNGEKYFAATSSDDSDESLYFLKLRNENGQDILELIDYDENKSVIDALIQHMENTFQ